MGLIILSGLTDDIKHKVNFSLNVSLLVSLCNCSRKTPLKFPSVSVNPNITFISLYWSSCVQYEPEIS